MRALRRLPSRGPSPALTRGCVALFRSTTQTNTKEYFQQDIDIFDFALTAAEMAKLDAKMAVAA